MPKIEPMQDNGQRLPGLHGHVIGIIDSSEQLDDAVDKLVAVGFSEEKMLCLAGAGGIALIERVDQHYFADAESDIGTNCISAIRQGKFVFAAKVSGADEAQKAASTAEEAGGHRFVHFGFFVNTQFN